MSDGDQGVTLDAIVEAAERISAHAHRTPVVTSATLNETLGMSLHFKCELLQKSGSFKFRGACNAVMSLDAEAAAKGVITHSSGNHGGALALAAKLRGIPADVVVPRGTPQCKQTSIVEYGATLHECEPTMDSRESTCAALQEQKGATFIHPYNYPPVICGQGTMALEFLDQVPHADAIIVPVSGGGMIAGISTAAKSIKPEIRIIAAEPVGCNDAADVARCKAAGDLVYCDRPDTIADGLQGRLGSITWPIVRDLVDGVITVTEEDIVNAMRLCYERLKLAVEPSGAVGLAAVLAGKEQSLLSGLDSVGVILCGGNLDLEELFAALLPR